MILDLHVVDVLISQVFNITLCVYTDKTTLSSVLLCFSCLFLSFVYLWNAHSFLEYFEPDRRWDPHDSHNPTANHDKETDFKDPALSSNWSSALCLYYDELISPNSFELVLILFLQLLLYWCCFVCASCFLVFFFCRGGSSPHDWDSGLGVLFSKIERPHTSR